jgi:hypothetical protein
MMADLPLSLALSDSFWVRALIDCRVKPQGIALDVRNPHPNTFEPSSRLFPIPSPF